MERRHRDLAKSKLEKLRMNSACDFKVSGNKMDMTHNGLHKAQENVNMNQKTISIGDAIESW